MSKIEDKAADLFKQALNEGHQGYINALKFMIPVASLIDQLKYEVNNETAISDGWKDALTREKYDLLSARKLMDKGLMQNSSYNNFAKYLVENVYDVDSCHHMIHGMISSGYHEIAMDSINGLDNANGFKEYFGNYIKNICQQSPLYYFAETGCDHNLTESTLKLLDSLDLDIPNSFSANDYPSRKINSNYKPWNESRFRMNIEAVGRSLSENGIKVPSAARIGAGPVVISNPELVTSFVAEKTRIESSMGNWHKENFPNYVPVVAFDNAIDELLERGAVQLEPKITSEYATPLGEIGTYPSHAFRSLTPQSGISQIQISLAMSLLSHEHISDLISSVDKKVVLVPFEQIQALAVMPCSIPEDLRIAMRYHRPELLICDEYFANGAANLSTRLYLRGAEVYQSAYKRLDLYGDVGDEPSLINNFVTSVEISELRKKFEKKGAGNDSELVEIREKSYQTLEANIERTHQMIELIIEKLGAAPRIKFIGSPDYLKALAKTTIELFEPNAIDVERGGDDKWHRSYAGIRVGASLGSVGYSYDLLEMSISELINKGARLKDNEDNRSTKMKILGLLDRYPLEEIAKHIKTDNQFNYVRKNYDLMPVAHALPKKFSLELAGESFSRDLGL